MRKLYIFSLLFLVGCGTSDSNINTVKKDTNTSIKRTIDKNLPNLLENTNPKFNTLSGYKNADKHVYISDDSHTDDGSGCAQLVTHFWKNALTSPTFRVQKSKKYLLSGYIKMTHVPKGQNIIFGITPREVAGTNQVPWNVSKQDTWQEILVPFIPLKDGNVSWRVFTSTNSFSTDIEYVETKYGVDIYRPKEVDENGTNLDRTSKVFFDDFKVVEIEEEITPREEIKDKKGFESDYIKVDKLGNMSVYKDEKWLPIIPKLISRGSPFPVERFRKRLTSYKSHGFNGVIGMYDKGQVIEAFDAGLDYFVGLGGKSNTQLDGTEAEYSSIFGGSVDRFKEVTSYIKSINKPYSRLFHYLDNENQKTQEYDFKIKWADFLDKNDVDTKNRRARPIFYLNGNYGIARAYSKKMMDITGAYVGFGGTGTPKEGAAKRTIGVMDVTQDLQAPANVIQLQVYLDNKFIPSLWFGIIQGGKVISVWRDGEGDGVDVNNPKPFEQYTWASSIKEVFKKVDILAPIIQTAHWTKWKVHLNGSEYINLGTREYKENGYVIISNHSDKDEKITLTFEGISPSKVLGYFKDFGIDKIVKNNKVTLNVGHGNDGYLVLKLVK